MKKVVWFILIFFTSTISVFGLDFYEGYYVDEFGDKTEEWYICSEAIFGTSPNTLGGITAFRGKLYIDNDNAFFEIKRQNGDTYSGDGTIHIKRENGDVVYFSADNEYGNFYPEDAESLRNLILNENIIKVVVTIDNTPYKFNLGEISLIELHTILASNGKISKQEQSIVSIETMILTTTGSIPRKSVFENISQKRGV